MHTATLLLLVALSSATTFAEPPPRVASFPRPAVLSKPTPHLPAGFKQAHPDGVYEAQYRIVVGLDGHVERVDVVQSLPGADEALGDFIRSNWRWAAAPVKWGFVERLRFNLTAR